MRPPRTHRLATMRVFASTAAVVGVVVALDVRAEPQAPPPRRVAPPPEPEGRTRAVPPTGAASEQAPGESGTADVGHGDALARPVAGSGETTPRRTLPDYDGRGEPGATAGDVALWVPRVLLSPAYFVSEYVLRRPLGALMTAAERNHWPSLVRDFFLFGPDKSAGIIPTAFLDFGMRPSVGIYAFWDGAFGPDHYLRLQATTFGHSWLQGALADRFPVGKNATVDLRVEGAHRPDQVFHGLGPTSSSRRARYGIDRLMARPVFEMTWWRGSRVLLEAGAKHVVFRDDACCSNPSLESLIQAGLAEPPPRFREGYTSLYQRAEVTLDTREPRPENQSGVRVELEVEQGSNAQRAEDNWIRYGGSVGGFLDIKNNRTVSLALTTLFADLVTSRSEIPFTEQVILGGSGFMRGYLYGRLIDRSAAVATLKYRWPVWVFLDGTMQAALGNVFGPQLEGFRPGLLRFSGAIGVESVGGVDHTFELLTGLGTETFDDNLRVTSFRLLFGTNRGF